MSEHKRCQREREPMKRVIAGDGEVVVVGW